MTNIKQSDININGFNNNPLRDVTCIYDDGLLYKFDVIITNKCKKVSLNQMTLWLLVFL